MKPYIEYNGTRYEFEGNIEMRRELEKEIQRKNQKLLTSGEITKEQLNQVKEFMNYKETLINYKEQDIESLPNEIKEKFLSIAPILNKLDNSEIYEKYCFLMLQNRYGICKAEWEAILQYYYDEYCESVEEIDEFISRIIELVFTQEDSKPKKAKMDWLKR